MTSKRDGANDARRDFLKLASLTAVTGGALAATGNQAAASEAPAEDVSGYHVSEHIATYYKLARF